MKEYIVAPSREELENEDGARVMASHHMEAARKAWAIGTRPYAGGLYFIRTAGEDDIEISFHKNNTKA